MTATTTPQQQAEDTTLSKVLHVTLTNPAPPSCPPNAIYLGSLVAELAQEQTTPPLLHGELLDRIVVARLTDHAADSAQWPVDYLLRCYERAGQVCCKGFCLRARVGHDLYHHQCLCPQNHTQEHRNAELFKDKAFVAGLQSTLEQLKGLLVAHTALLLSMDVFPQPPAATARGACQLLDAMQGRNNMHMPVGFLDDFAQHFVNNDETSTLDEILVPIGRV